MNGIEFIPPGEWRTVWFTTVGRSAGAAVFWRWSHWAFGFEAATTGATLLFGPLAIALGFTREAPQTWRCTACGEDGWTHDANGRLEGACPKGQVTCPLEPV